MTESISLYVLGTTPTTRPGSSLIQPLPMVLTGHDWANANSEGSIKVVRAARNFLVVPVGIVWPQPLVWGQPRPAEAPWPAASPHPRAQPAQVRSPQAELRAAGAVAVLLAPCSGFPSSHLCGKLAPGGPGCCPVTHLLLLIPKFRVELGGPSGFGLVKWTLGV